MNTKELLRVEKFPDHLIIRLLFEENVYKRRINYALVTFVVFNMIAIAYVLILNTGIFTSTAGYKALVQNLTLNNIILSEMILWMTIAFLMMGMFSLFLTAFTLPIELYLFLKRKDIMVALDLDKKNITLKKHNGLKMAEFYSITPKNFLGLIIRSEKNRFTFGRILHCISMVCWNDATTKIPMEYLITHLHQDEKMILSVIKELKQLIFSHYGYNDEDIQLRWLKMNPYYAKKYNVPIEKEITQSG